MWWCSYCGTNFRRPSVLLGRRWLRLTWSSWYPMYAKGWRWMPLSTKAKNDSRSQATWSKRSFLRKSTHSCCIKNRASLFMGCWGLRIIRSPWYSNIPCRWRWLSILTYSKTCKCPKPFEINQSILWRCAHYGIIRLRRNLLLWRRILWITWIRKYFRNATWCWFVSIYACSQKNRQFIKSFRSVTCLWWFTFDGPH